MKTTTTLLLAAAAALSSCASTSSGGGATDREAINIPGRALAAVYSNAVRAGDTVYLSGKLGIDPATGEIPPRIEDEVRIIMDGLAEVLAAAGLTMNDLVSVTVFCTDPGLYDQFNAVYGTYFDGDFPARAFIGSGPLLRGAHFEVKGIAVRSN